MESKSLMSIKAFSKLCGVEQSTLRYWDEVGLFLPAHRNTETGYRYYAPDQMERIQFIKLLSSLNIPLKVIAKTSEHEAPEAVLQLLEQQEALFDAELLRLHEAYSTAHALRDALKQRIDASGHKH